MYADDTTLYCAALSEQAVTSVLGNALDEINKWVGSNKLILNISKTKSILFGSRHRLAKNPELKLVINVTNIEQVDSIKLLGLTIDSSLSWSKHINNIVVKMGNGIRVTRKCSEFITPSILKSVIHSLVLSHLEYCPVVWSSASQSDLKKLQVAQNKAARLALNCSYRTGINVMHSNLMWMTVAQKMSMCLLMLLRSIISTNLPSSLADQVHMTSDHGYSTRGAVTGHIMLPAPRTNSRKLTFLYRSIALWNSLPKDIKAKVNYKSCFKKLTKIFLTIKQ